MSQRLEIYVSCLQLAVFKAGLDQPFNKWADKQVEVGCAWTPNSVSFKTPVDDGVCLVELMEAQERTSSAKSIEVPFDVPDDERSRWLQFRTEVSLKFVRVNSHCAMR